MWVRPRDHRQPGDLAHRPDLTRKKSRSIMSCPTFSCSAETCALSTVSAAAAFFSPPNSPFTPSCTVFFQAFTWLACTPYLLEISAIVPSSRIAAIATFALNSALCFLRMFVTVTPWLNASLGAELYLSHQPSFRGPPQRVYRRLALD